MSDQDALTPRVFILRHGPTEWAKSGRFTSFTDIELTQEGTAQVSLLAMTVVGTGKLIDPSRLAHVFVSPRKRTTTTFELLLPPSNVAAEVTLTEDIAEWNYGEYEGLKNHEIRALRKEQGLDLSRDWSIWSDGCPGGESKQQVTERLDRLISRIKAIQEPFMRGEKPADVVLVAHGLVLRCFLKRWINLSIDSDLPLMMEPGALAVLSYKNNNIDEPAVHMGIAIPPKKEHKG